MQWSNNNKRITENKLHYSINSSTRGNFKSVCWRNEWNFNDFEEIESGEKNGIVKRFYYCLKIKEVEDEV